MPKHSWGSNYEVVKRFSLSQHSTEVKPEVLSWGQPLWKKSWMKQNYFECCFFVFSPLKDYLKISYHLNLSLNIMILKSPWWSRAFLPGKNPIFWEKSRFHSLYRSRAGPRLQNSTLWLAVKWHTKKKIDVPTQLNRKNQSKIWVVSCWVRILTWLPVWKLLNFFFCVCILGLLSWFLQSLWVPSTSCLTHISTWIPWDQ